MDKIKILVVDDERQDAETGEGFPGKRRISGDRSRRWYGSNGTIL